MPGTGRKFSLGLDFGTNSVRALIIDYTKYSGGTYSSEWFFSKLLHLAKVDPEVYEAAVGFVEHCDLIPALLAGDTNPRNMKRSRCAAGHKAMFNRDWGGLPAEDFLCRVDARLKGVKGRLYEEICAADVKVGRLSKEWAERLSLSEGLAVTGGAFDAHMGAVGAGIQAGTLVKIMGTSTCDMMIVPRVFTFDETPAKALRASIMLEYAAMIAKGALESAFILGVSLSAMPPEEAKLWYARHHGGGYGQDE